MQLAVDGSLSWSPTPCLLFSLHDSGIIFSSESQTPPPFFSLEVWIGILNQMAERSSGGMLMLWIQQSIGFSESHDLMQWFHPLFYGSYWLLLKQS